MDEGIHMKSKWIFRFITFLTVLGIALLPSVPLSAVEGMPLGATVSPNITWDDYDTGAFDSNCSLREALITVMSNSDFGGCTHGVMPWGYDTISLGSGPYELTLEGDEDLCESGDLDIVVYPGALPAGPIQSPSAGNPDITLQGNLAGYTTINANYIDRVFQIGSGVTVAMDHVAITGGDTEGNSLTNGGGIWVQGGLTLSNSSVWGNTTSSAPLVGYGGGIANSGTLTITHTYIHSNSTASNTVPAQTGMGGGIYNIGELYLTDVSVYNNYTGNNNSTGTAGGGAGLANIGDASMTRVTIANNYCGHADEQNGAPGGGIYNEGELSMHTSTISHNYSGAGGADGGNHNGGRGGGVWNASDGIITIIEDSTITNNHTGSSSGSGFTSGGGLYGGGSVTIENSILANNYADQSPDCGGGFVSNGFNLVEITTLCTITGVGDTITGQDPMLAPLTDLGVEGKMHRLLPGSPAIDAGPATCGATDQRHQQRAIDGDRDGIETCDIGSYEALLYDYLPFLIRP
jgi:hypothetical protein